MKAQAMSSGRSFGTRGTRYTPANVGPLSLVGFFTLVGAPNALVRRSMPSRDLLE